MEADEAKRRRTKIAGSIYHCNKKYASNPVKPAQTTFLSYSYYLPLEKTVKLN